MKNNSLRLVIGLASLLFILLLYANFSPKCLPYDIKTDFVRTKEFLVERLLFGAYDKTLWNINLSDKRMVEAGRFGICGDKKREEISIDEAIKRRSLAEKFFEETKKGGEDMNYLKERMEKNKELFK